MRPARWVWLVAAAAWAVMIAHRFVAPGPACHDGLSAPAELGLWLAMVGAMMLPFTERHVHAAAARSLWPRRRRAMLLWTAAYLAIWIAPGLLAIALHRARVSAALLFAAAAVWQLVPLRAVLHMQMHRRAPLAPSGARADRDLLAYGGRIGLACAATCGPLMLACAVSGHAPIAMAGGAALTWWERRAFRPPGKRLAVAALVLAAAVV